MANPTQNNVAGGHCPVCHEALPPQIPPNRCPHCLLRAGLETQPEAVGGETAVTLHPLSSLAIPQPGELFGHYQIVRLLGEGGMGTVFEAEDLESSRRVALKVLGHRLDSPEARSRFFREGRLSASVNHPNSVYVYGTEEIAGVPVIAMELVAGGTLQGRVSRQGPLPVAEAVDSGLQIIAGLEAAQRLGVLHRDIKPSNCFVDTDGTVKIGDFGLSISTFVRTEPVITATGTFLGTPAFSSPEQLRGDELTVRSDIYSLGVTLYYLLTGHHPFEAMDMVRLLATVLEKRAASPAKWRRELPSGLCRVVLRCLEKDPDKRFRNYADLRTALLAYASTAATPATLGMRLLAYCLDMLLLFGPIQGVLWLLFPDFRTLTYPMVYLQPKLLLVWLCAFSLMVVNFGLLEGLWGASAGKAICGLRVARRDRTVPGVPRALFRAFIFLIPSNAIWLLTHCLTPWNSGQGGIGWLMFLNFIPVAMMALLFSTARRRNSFAGWHDLASRTRVIVRSAYHARPSLPPTDEVLPNLEATPLIGPYHVLDQLGSEDGTELLLGFDTRLLRRVWIRKLRPGTPPVSPNLRHLGRPGRLRWLNGQRTDAGAWDAYEATPGQPLLRLLAKPQSWSRVRYWLLDLTEEMHAATQDGSLPAALALDRVWITEDGRAKLLDFPAPGTAVFRPALPAGADLVQPSPPAFLRRVAISALEGRAVNAADKDVCRAKAPLALHASRFLETLLPDASLAEKADQLRSKLDAPAMISRARRLALLAGSMAFPVLATMLGGEVHSFMAGFLRAAPELATLRECLVHHQELQQRTKSGNSDGVLERDAFETYIRGRFAPVITNATIWSKFGTRMVIPDPLRREAERIQTRTPAPSPEQFAKAAASMERFFNKSPDVAASEVRKQATTPLVALVVGYGNGVLFVILPCLLASLLFRGGALVQALGIVFVNPDGGRSPGWRVAWRSLLAWLPFLLLPINVKLLTPMLGVNGSMLITAGFSTALALISALLPQRGLQDRLAHTWPVPR